MTTKPEALRLADRLESDFIRSQTMVDAAAELRRLHAENEQLAELVCDYAAEETPDAIRTVAADRDRWHTKAQQFEAQRNQLFEALKTMLEQFNFNTITGIVHDESEAIVEAYAAIAMVERQ